MAGTPDQHRLARKAGGSANRLPIVHHAYRCDPRPKTPPRRPLATARNAPSGFRFRYRKVWGFKCLLVHYSETIQKSASGKTVLE